MRISFLVTAALLVLLCQDTQAKLVLLGFNAQGNDGFTIGLLDPLPAGSELRFRDDEWSGTTFNSGAPSDNYFSFKPAATLPAGTILNFQEVNLSEARRVIDGYGVTISGVFGGREFGVYLPLQASQEGLYVYHGTSFDVVTTPLASLRTNTPGGTLFGVGVDFVGTPLQDGDILAYTGPGEVDGALTLFEALVTNPANWTLQADTSRGLNGAYAPITGLLRSTVAIPETTSTFIGCLMTASIGSMAGRRRRYGGLSAS